MTTEQDYQQRFIKVIADDEECVFIVPTSVLEQANIAIGDKCIVVAENNEIIIRKAGELRAEELEIQERGGEGDGT